jgi:cytochrome c oxidase subunit 2
VKKPILFILVVGGALMAGLFALFHRFPMMPVAAAEEALMVDRAFNGLLALSIVIYSLIVAALFYSLLFHRSTGPTDEGDRFDASRGHWLEKSWIGLSLVLTLGLAAFGSYELKEIRYRPPAEVEVLVNAAQFSWEFAYPAYEGETASKLYLPLGKRARIILTSKDVIHSFWVPEFRLKQDALPGKVTSMIVTPTRVGEYELRCAELCGSDHTGMISKVEVLSPEDFDVKMKGESW